MKEREREREREKFLGSRTFNSVQPLIKKGAIKKHKFYMLTAIVSLYTYMKVKKMLFFRPGMSNVRPVGRSPHVENLKGLRNPFILSNFAVSYLFFLLKTKLSRIYIAIIITKIKRPLKPCKFLKGCSTW